MIAALGLRPLAHLSEAFQSDVYHGWQGDTERKIDWQSGCCVLFRADLLKRLGGFDERFFYHYEEVDLCYRVWEAGFPIVYTPKVVITHLGGQSVGRFPIRFALERNRNCYKYFHKHFGRDGVTRCRQIMLTHLRVRKIGYTVLSWLRPSDSVRNRLEMYRVTIEWNQLLDPIAFAEHGTEPQIEALQSGGTARTVSS